MASFTARTVQIKRDLNAKATAGVLVAAGAVQIVSLIAMNNSASVIFLKLYDKSTAPTSSDTPVKTIPLAINCTGPLIIAVPRWNSENEPSGYQFANGLGYRCCANIADSDNTDPSSNACVLNIEYFA